MTKTRRGILYVTAALAVAGPTFVWLFARLPVVPRGSVVVPVALAGAGIVPVEGARDARGGSGTDVSTLVQRDPISVVRLGRQRLDREVRDYRCVLIKQERLGGGLSAVEEIEVRWRTRPLAIYMIWRKNATQVKRALFKDDPAFVDAEGNKLARIEPAGAIVRLLVSDLFMPIHGERARQTSRRAIDECGFGPIFDLFERYCELARRSGVLDMRHAGNGTVDQRPTYVIVRHLPYTGEDGPYPDAKLVLHLDQEWLLPVAVESYADREGTRLLGRYVFTRVELNPGLTEQDFAF